ncbi:MAG: hydroxymethylbilane synthase [Candidatus Omnitrophica bacterium]|nr:hydroxymethylbilane synthase [Candidatus Omnitrophota bacterium]
MNNEKKIIIGSRKSLLAMKQSKIVMENLNVIFPNYTFEIKGIITSGDRLKTWPKNQSKGMFVKEIEEALIRGEIDFAVHSMKDLPVDMPDGLEIAAITKREKHGDVLISRNLKKLTELEIGSCVGTSSPRRKMQLLLIRDDLKIADIRGNLDTRLKKLENGEYDAIVVAAAGILRLGWLNRITEYLSDDIMLPAPAQGALGIQIRKNDKKIQTLIKKLNFKKTEIEVKAEREFLRAMGGGCRVPIGALARVKAEALHIEAIVIKNKTNFCRTAVKGSKKNPQILGKKLAKKIKTILMKKAQKRGE